MKLDNSGKNLKILKTRPYWTTLVPMLYICNVFHSGNILQ